MKQLFSFSCEISKVLLLNITRTRILSSASGSFNCHNFSSLYRKINKNGILDHNNQNNNRLLFENGPYKNITVSYSFSRGKSPSKVNKKDINDEEDEDDKGLDQALLQDVDGSDVKIIRTRLNSLRLDSLLKAALGTSKNKIETAFYESKIRVNGEKILKKSKNMNIGDEIDLIKGSNALNPLFLDISRVLVISAEHIDNEKMVVILKRYKSMTVENYVDNFRVQQKIE